MEEQTKVLQELKSRNNTLIQENQELQKEITEMSSTLDEKIEEINQHRSLLKENQRLHNRERFLSAMLVEKHEVLGKLKKPLRYIEEQQWKPIKEAINLLFDNYTERLVQQIPTLTESDLQICCLIKLHFTNTEIAALLAISTTSVTKRKVRLKERILQEIDSFDESQMLDLWL